MKNQPLITLALLLSAFPLLSQHTSSNLFCSYYGEHIGKSIYLSEGSAKAKNVIQNIISVVGLKPNYEVKAANVPNAAATIAGSKRYILYNPEFMALVNSTTKTDWAAISIIAHEIGHHLNGHTLITEGSRPDTELEADEFSGFVLRKLGASLVEAQAAMATFNPDFTSPTHPSKNDRLASIETGWKNAGKELIATSEAPSANIAKPAIDKASTDRNPISENAPRETIGNAILNEVRFTATPQVKYYITSRLELVKEKEGKLVVVGRLRESNKKEYPYLIYDKKYQLFYVSKTGEIVNSKGLKVGFLKIA